MGDDGADEEDGAPEGESDGLGLACFDGACFDGVCFEPSASVSPPAGSLAEPVGLAESLGFAESVGFAGLGLAVSGEPGSTEALSASSFVSPAMAAQLAQGVAPSAAYTFLATAICWERLARSGRAAYCPPPYLSQVACENWRPP